MIVNSSRFGQLEVPPGKVITMERSILGFEAFRRFCLVEIDELRPFLWLQSVEDPAIAFLVVNPLLIFPEYRIEVNSNEIAELKVACVESIETYVVVTIPSDPRKMSVNLQGPILINTENGLAKQLVLVNSQYSIRHPVLDSLQEQQPETVSEEELVGV
jgi:flagellar assembly factor FliW